MELDIRNLSPYDSTARDLPIIRESSTVQKIKKEKAQALEQSMKEQLTSGENVDAEKYLQEILRMSEMFNRELKFSVDRELGTVIVKVVDGQTDKVIKELPPKELQRLYSAMKDAIGLLIDEQI